MPLCNGYQKLMCVHFCSSLLRRKGFCLLSLQEKLKWSLPLAAIEAVVKLPEDSTSLKVTGRFEHPLVLQASQKDECQEWIRAIENGKLNFVNLNEDNCCPGQGKIEHASDVISSMT